MRIKTRLPRKFLPTFTSKNFLIFWHLRHASIIQEYVVIEFFRVLFISFISQNTLEKLFFKKIMLLFRIFNIMTKYVDKIRGKVPTIFRSKNFLLIFWYLRHASIECFSLVTVVKSPIILLIFDSKNSLLIILAFEANVACLAKIILNRINILEKMHEVSFLELAKMFVVYIPNVFSGIIFSYTRNLLPNFFVRKVYIQS